MTDDSTYRIARWARRGVLPSYLVAREALAASERVARAAIMVRSRTGWSQDELAVQLGISTAEVEAIERGHHAVPRDVVEELVGVARVVASASKRAPVTTPARPESASQAALPEDAAAWAQSVSTV